MRRLPPCPLLRSLPPDWHTLHKMRELCVINGEHWAAELQDTDGRLWGGFDWGSASLSALSSLTWLQLSEDAVLPGGLGGSAFMRTFWKLPCRGLHSWME